ncbi:MAG TPA: hypothetical protein VMU02_03500 [bacterium]|nr:hypothetical protein [bacterium]
MTRKQAVVASGLCLFAALALSLLPGCAAKKAMPAAGGGAVTLEYRLPPTTPVIYRNSESSTQTMQMMNQYINTDTKKVMVFTIKPGTIKDNKQPLNITVDSLSVAITTPQGDFSAKVDQVVGKSFDMALTTLGEELDFTGVDLLQYSLGPTGTRSIKPDFETMFPNLADKALKVGDTWTTSDTADVDEGGMKLKIITDKVNTLDGFEDLNGTKCARIITTSKGTVKGEGQQQGMNVSLSTQMTGNDSWLFATQRGLVAKLTSDVSMDGTVAVGGPQGMSIPMKQQMKTELVLVK